MSEKIIHLAGPLSSEGVQLCSRCGHVLDDRRNKVSLCDYGLDRGWGWSENDEIMVEGRFSANVTAAPELLDDDAVRCKPNRRA